MAESIKLTDDDSGKVKTSEDSFGPEEDNLLELGAEASLGSMAQARAQLQVQALMKARALSQLGARAQAKVGVQDANLISLLKKQIASMEAKQDPARAAAAAKKKAVHNI